MKKYKTGIYVGEFYPFQQGHLQTLNKISNICEKVFLVFYYDENSENDLNKQLNYNIDERISDVRLILNDKNVEVVKFIPPKDLTFPKDYLDIKKDKKKTGCKIKKTKIYLHYREKWFRKKCVSTISKR